MFLKVQSINSVPPHEYNINVINSLKIPALMTFRSQLWHTNDTMDIITSATKYIMIEHKFLGGGLINAC